MDSTLQVLSIIAPILICAGVGFIWHRLALPFNTAFVTTLVTNIAAPCLIINRLSALNTSFVTFSQILIAGLLLIISCLFLGALTLRILKQPVRDFLPAIAFGNSGNMGLPLAYFAFGEVGLGLAIGLFILSTLSQATAQPLLLSGKSSIRTLVSNPIFSAAIMGALLFVSGTPLPPPLAKSTALLGELTIPLMLISLGYSLGGIRLQAIGFASRLAFVRAAVGIASGLTICYWLDLDGLPRNIILLQSIMPSAVFNYLMASRYERSPDKVAGIVLMSTSLSLIMIPCFLAAVIFPD